MLLVLSSLYFFLTISFELHSFLILNNLNLNIIFRSRGRHFHFNHVTGIISIKMKKETSWRPGKYFNIGSTWCDNGELLRENIPQNQTQWVLSVRPTKYKSLYPCPTTQNDFIKKLHQMKEQSDLYENFVNEVSSCFKAVSIQEYPEEIAQWKLHIQEMEILQNKLM